MTSELLELDSFLGKLLLFCPQGSDHSALIDFTGLAKAALRICRPIVIKEIKSNIRGGAIKIKPSNEIWKA
jgi:hypothetical protein